MKLRNEAISLCKHPPTMASGLLGLSLRILPHSSQELEFHSHHKAEPTMGRSCPFLYPTTDVEQPLCSFFPSESSCLTLSNTIRVPARREEKAFCSLQQNGPSRVTQLEKGITGM